MEKVTADSEQQVLNESKGNDTVNVAVAKEENEEPKVKTYKNGTYLVGKDIDAGLYKVRLTDHLTKMGYIERAKEYE